LALKAIVDTLDGVDEALQGLYAKGEDGKFRLELEGAETEEEVAGLRSALQKERERAKTYEARLKKLPEGFDPSKDLEELATLRKEREEREAREAEKKGEWDKLRAQLQEQQQKREEEWNGKVQNLESELDRLLRSDRAKEEIGKRGASIRLLLREVLSQTRTIVDDSGRRKVVVVDDSGDRRLNGKGDDMTMAELLDELEKDPDCAGAFPAPESTGGGASGRRVAGSGHEVASKADLKDRAAKVAFIDQHGVDAYNALPTK
jgi:hypothetical protein